MFQLVLVNLLLILINVCFKKKRFLKIKVSYLDGQGCIIFTVIIHPNFFRRAHSSQTFMNFLLTLIYEGLENKYPQFKLETGKIHIISLIIFLFSFWTTHTHTIKSINRKKNA